MLLSDHGVKCDLCGEAAAWSWNNAVVMDRNVSGAACEDHLQQLLPREGIRVLNLIPLPFPAGLEAMSEAVDDEGW